MQDPLRYLQNFINDNLPLARNMGIQALAYSGDALRLAAPLPGNTNHHATAFGGSIATLGIVAGWSLLHLRLLEEAINADLVIHKTECTFLKPVRSDFQAHCSLDDRQWPLFRQQLQERGKARLALSSQIICEQQTVAALSSSYAALLARSGS